MQQWNLLIENVRISVYCKRYEDLVHFFQMERGLVACTDIDGLMQTLDINHIPLDWRLSIDSSKLSLKAVLLHNGNTLPSIPVGNSVHNKESYEDIKILMEAIHKILLLHLLTGQRVRSLHYTRKDWPARKSLESGITNVENQPLVELSKILWPSMHLKFGLTKIL